MTPQIVTTVLAALAVLLSSTSLAAVYADWGWWAEGAGAVLAVAAGATLARLARLPALLQPFAGLLAGAWYTAVVFAPDTLAGGLLPTRESAVAIGTLLGEGLLDVEELQAPVPSTTGLVLIAVLSLVLVSTLVDLLAVSVAAPALAGLPLLALIAVPAATVPGGAGWLPFVLAAVGWLALLRSDDAQRIARWGTTLRAARARGATVSAERSIGRLGRRIGATAVAAGVLVPALVPGLEARVFTEGGWLAGGAHNAVVYNPLTDLAGRLRLPTPQPLLRYSTTDDDPEYVRLTTLDAFDAATGWSSSKLSGDIRDDRVSERGLTPAALDDTEFEVASSTIRIQQLGGPWLPVPMTPTDVEIDGPWLWDDLSETVFSTRTSVENVDAVYNVASAQPMVTAEDLRQEGPRPAELDEFAVPPAVSEYVQQLTDTVVGNATSDYDEVVAIQAFFRDRRNGFVYSESTAVPEMTAPNALEAFLREDGRRGFCEQYASAMAAMVRLRGIPARVAVGFTAGRRTSTGDFQVTTDEAHAWPEVWFPAAGWVRFEPTPRSGEVDTPSYSTPARDANEQDPTEQAAAQPTPTPAAPQTPNQAQRDRLAGDDTAAGAGSGSSWPSGLFGVAAVTALVVLALLAVPAVLARVRRQRQAGDAESAWRELAAEAGDVGHRWNPAESPRTAAERLVRERELDGESAAAVHRMAAAVERARYAPPRDGRRDGHRDGQGDGADLRRDLQRAREGLLASAPRWVRWRARVLPPSAVRWAGQQVRATTASVQDRIDGAAARAVARVRRSPA